MNSGCSGQARIAANGLLPTKGNANFDLEVSDFAVENIAELLQSDLPVTGRLTLDAHVSGTSEDPKIAGKIDFVQGHVWQGRHRRSHGTFSYADKQLTTDAAATDTAGKTLASIKGTVPINLALSGVTGSRLLDLPVNAVVLGQLAARPRSIFHRRHLGHRRTCAGRRHRGWHAEEAIAQGQPHAERRALQDRVDGDELRARERFGADDRRHRVKVSSMRGIALGPVGVRGAVAVGNWRSPSFNLDVNAHDAQLLDNESGDIHADAALHISGPVDSAFVTGNVTVLHGVFYVPASTGRR